MTSITEYNHNNVNYLHKEITIKINVFKLHLCNIRTRGFCHSLDLLNYSTKDVHCSNIDLCDNKISNKINKAAKFQLIQINPFDPHFAL